MSIEANPARIGRYEIQKPLGSGAMGDVYLAHDPNIDRLVAIKTVRVIGGNDEDIADRRGRLLREARAAGKFQHPNVVALYDAGEAAGLLYLAFEYVPGHDLLKRARQAPEMTLREVLRVVRETASALDYAWHRNVVHRDIKPSNILLGPKGEAKVADFGIAKLRDQSVELTRTGSVVGSPQYMSPEQIRGEELDGRSDVFSLGVVFYELLSRTRPFGGDTISTLVFEILAKEPMPIESLRPGLSQGLVQLVRSMMVKDRNQRIADAGLVVQAIEKLERETSAAELDSPASQATGADVQPTMLMPSGAAPVPSPTGPLAGSGGVVVPPPYPTGAAPGSVPMGPPMPSGPLAPLPSGPMTPVTAGPPPAATGSPGFTGPPVPPPNWGAPPPAPAMTPPPMAQHPPGPPQPPVPPQPYQQPPAYPQQGPPPTYGQPPQPPGYGQGVPPPHGHPQQAYGAPAPRPNYPTAKPTSPLKLLLLLGGLGLFAVVGVVVLLLIFGGDDTPANKTAETPSLGTEAPPPPPEGTDAEPLVTATVHMGDPAPSGTQTEPTWNEPQPSSGPAESTDAGDPEPPPAPTAPTRSPGPSSPGPSRQNDGGGALARLGEAIGGNEGSDSAGSEDSADGADSEPSPRPRLPTPEPTNSAWQEAASGANSEMETGLRFQFKVTPPEAKVLFWPRDDRRAIVQGSAGEFDPKKDEDARVLELPDDGEYLILLRHGDFPDHVIHVHADRSRGQRPKLLQLSLGRGGGGGSGNTATSIKVSRGVSFAGTPGDAYVFVNGRAQGRTSDYPGGEKRSAANLKLDRGKNVVRLEAPGFKPLEIRVEVGSGAPAVEQITYRLEKE